MVIVRVVSVRMAAISSSVRTMKSSLSPGWILCRTRRTAEIASATCLMLSADAADTVIFSM